MEPNQKKIDKGYRKRKGRIMFPTSHDITEESLEGCLIVLKKLLDAEDEVLITTKPRLTCVKKICKQFMNKKDLIQFRFTITSNDNEKLKFWESGAPSFEERFEALKYTFKEGFKTSISIEPFLDKNPYKLVERLKPYVSESIWIGKLNYLQAKGQNPKEKKYYNMIRRINSEENLKEVILSSKNFKPIVRIKDSIINFLYNN